MFERLLRFLRNRPVHERRILAATMYLSTAAIVLAIGITSIGRAIALPGNAGVSGTGAPNSETAAVASSQDKLSSPFETLKQSMQQIAEGVREIRQAWQNPGIPLVEPAPEATTTVAVTNDDAASVEPKSPPPAPRTPTAFNEIPILTATTTSAIATSAEKNTSDTLEALADLVSPVGAVAEPVLGSRHNANGLWASLLANFNSASQTVVNAYNAMFE